MHTSIRRWTPGSPRYRGLVAAGAIALAVVTLPAPAAVATPKNPNPAPIPEKTIKSQCEDPGLDGVYGTRMVGNVRFSSCDYTDGDGKYCSDSYHDGVFQSTDCARQAPTSPGQVQSIPGNPAIAPEPESPQAPPPAGTLPLPPGGGTMAPR
jgi:hypothetical protein